jgi:hypothetical protein
LALEFLATKAITLSLPDALAAPLADALEHLREVASGDRAAALDGLADALAGETPRDLTGPPEVIRELLAVALDEAGERVSDASTRLLRGEDTTAELRSSLSEASALLELLERSSAAR